MLGIKAALSNTDEQETPVKLVVRGQIPWYVKGSLYRAGPGKFDIPLDKSPDGSRMFTFDHWFDGLTQIHKFSIQGGESGTVEYSNKFTAKEVETKIAESGKYPSVSFGQRDPCRSIFGKLKTVFRGVTAASKEKSKVSNIGVVIDASFPWPLKVENSSSNTKEDSVTDEQDEASILVFTDANVFMKIDGDLGVKGFYTFGHFDGSLKGVLSAAHSCIDIETNER
jgi:torulene dioxygenase